MTMKYLPVKPAMAFCNGTNRTITMMNVQSVRDNLFDEVTFKYTLASDSGEWAGEGAYTLGPDKYGEWDATPRGAYEMVAAGIGLELVVEAPTVSDYVNFSREDA